MGQCRNLKGPFKGLDNLEIPRGAFERLEGFEGRENADISRGPFKGLDNFEISRGPFEGFEGLENAEISRGHFPEQWRSCPGTSA